MKKEIIPISTMNEEIDLEELRQMICLELDKITDRLIYHNSSLANEKIDLKQHFKLGPLKDNWQIDTTMDASLYYLIQQTIKLCTNKYLLSIITKN